MRIAILRPGGQRDRARAWVLGGAVKVCREPPRKSRHPSVLRQLDGYWSLVDTLHDNGKTGDKHENMDMVFSLLSGRTEGEAKQEDANNP